MTDSVAVFSPGWRLLDASGDPVSGGVIRFYDAGTSTPKTVYSDETLTTSLGTSVTTDSGGYPTSDGSTKTEIYVGTASYKVTAETSGAVSLWSHDDVKGAVTELSASDFSVVADFTVVTKSLDYTILEADQLTHFMTNCTGGDVTYTLPSAVTVGTGWQVTIQHAGTANAAIIATVSSQTITLGATSYGTQYALAREGQEVTLRSNGGNWVIAAAIGNPLMTGNFVIEDRVSGAPGAPVTGGYYIVSGAYSTFEQEDVIYYNGSAYTEITPVEDCGWVAYVVDEDVYYRFVGTAWVLEATHLLAQKNSNVVVDTYATSTSLSTALPFDDTIPQNTEGTEILSVSITPSTSSKKILLTFNGFGGGANNAPGGRLTAALFRTGSADALQVSTSHWYSSTVTAPVVHVGLQYLDSPASASEQTYTIRVGSVSGGYVYMNSSDSTRYFGGSAAATLVAMEVD